MKNKYINRFYKDGELDDREIIIALVDALDMYDNGEIIEVRDTLAQIVNAIDRFTEEYNI